MGFGTEIGGKARPVGGKAIPRVQAIARTPEAIAAQPKFPGGGGEGIRSVLGTTNNFQTRFLPAGGASRGRAGGGMGIARKRSPFAEESSASGGSVRGGLRRGRGNAALNRFRRPGG